MLSEATVARRQQLYRRSIVALWVSTFVFALVGGCFVLSTYGSLAYALLATPAIALSRMIRSALWLPLIWLSAAIGTTLGGALYMYGRHEGFEGPPIVFVMVLLTGLFALMWDRFVWRRTVVIGAFAFPLVMSAPFQVFGGYVSMLWTFALFAFSSTFAGFATVGIWPRSEDKLPQKLREDGIRYAFVGAVLLLIVVWLVLRAW